jgi:hypothetical protein
MRQEQVLDARPDPQAFCSSCVQFLKQGNDPHTSIKSADDPESE